MMWRTFRMSTANCITERQLRSVCTTRLAMLRWTNSSPGSRPTIWLAGTRLSEQPIQRYSGNCWRESLLKNSGSCRRIACDQARLASKRCLRERMLPAGPASAKERNEVVLADALKHEEGGRGLARVGDEVRPARRHGIGLPRLERHVLLGALQEDPDRALQHVERVLDVAVVMPGHLLGLRKLQLVDAEPRALGMAFPALDLVEMTGVLQRFHSILASSVEYSASTLAQSAASRSPPSLRSYCALQASSGAGSGRRGSSLSE